MVRKHCGKRRKCWLSAFSPFPTMFFKRLLLYLSKVKAFSEDKINVSLKQILFWDGKKTLWEEEKMLATSIFSFSHNGFKRLLLYLSKVKAFSEEKMNVS